MKFRNFVTTGEAQDQEWIINNQLLLETYIHDEMREKGFIPVLDIDTDVRWWYNKESETFNFRLSIKGLKIGKRQAKKYLGVHSKQGVLVDLEHNPTPLVEVAA